MGPPIDFISNQPAFADVRKATLVLRLTLLAPHIVEAILDGRQTAEQRLDDLLRGSPLEWEGQRSRPLVVPEVAVREIQRETGEVRVHLVDGFASLPNPRRSSARLLHCSIIP